MDVHLPVEMHSMSESNPPLPIPPTLQEISLQHESQIVNYNLPSLTSLVPDHPPEGSTAVTSIDGKRDFEPKEEMEEINQVKGTPKKPKKEKKEKLDFQTVYRKTKKSSIHRRLSETLESLFPDNPASLLRSYLHHSKRGQEINREMKLIEEKSTKSFPALIESMKKELKEKKNTRDLEDLFIKLMCSSGYTREDVRDGLGIKKLGWKRWKKFRAITGKKKDSSIHKPIETEEQHTMVTETVQAMVEDHDTGINPVEQRQQEQ